MYEITNSDWKKYREKNWHLARKLYGEIVKGICWFSENGWAGVKRFWELEKRIKQDKKCPGVLITDMRKSSAIYDIAALVREEIISIKELDDFSDDLQEAVNNIVNH